MMKIGSLHVLSKVFLSLLLTFLGILLRRLIGLNFLLLAFPRNKVASNESEVAGCGLSVQLVSRPISVYEFANQSLEYGMVRVALMVPIFLHFNGFSRFKVTGRKVGNEWRTIPQNREEVLPDSGLEDDEDEEDEDAFDDGARPRRRGATEPAYMEVDERELEEDDADYEEEEEEAYEEPNGWRAAEARINQRFDAWSNENRVFQEETRSRLMDLNT
ncbi:hypothetical protein CASFOL_012336 [Castilleja foliolosa]|uniref:Uncharacterized protein n=1 Tax=Castilleja foliolosa TaxID=1961234 RepID=A0ABD3DTS1_9LAMI